MSPCGVVNCKAFGPLGPLLTNRMTQLVTYGSVGGVGRKPGPYPAPNRAGSFLFVSQSSYFSPFRSRPVGEPERSACTTLRETPQPLLAGLAQRQTRSRGMACLARDSTILPSTLRPGQVGLFLHDV
jgi:hypothetical protein